MIIKAISAVYRKLLGNLNEILRPYGLNASDWRVFSYLAVHIKSPPSAIAAAYEMDRASMSRVLAKLENAELIEVTSSDDKREKLICLSAKAVQMHFEINAKIKLFSDSALSGIDALSQGQFLKIIEQINKNLDDIGEK